MMFAFSTDCSDCSSADSYHISQLCYGTDIKSVCYGRNIKACKLEGNIIMMTAKHSRLFVSVFTVRRYALHGICGSNSVCPSVCHTRGLCPHGSTYDHNFFTMW